MSNENSKDDQFLSFDRFEDDKVPNVLSSGEFFSREDQSMENDNNIQKSNFMKGQRELKGLISKYK
jgi:hypothetical protein